jgi:hypothetical protein
MGQAVVPAGIPPKLFQCPQDLDIDIYASFIVRMELNKEGFNGFRRYCRRLGSSLASFAMLTPLPGTDLYDQVKAQLITHNYDDFDLLPEAVFFENLPLIHRFR